MNIRNFIREGIESVFSDSDIYYHGSNSMFEKFDLINNKTYKEFDIPSWFFTKNIDYAKTYGKYLYVVKLNIKNTFDTSNQKHYKIFIKQLKELGNKNSDIQNILDEQFYNGIPYWTCEDAFYTAKAHDFDSILIQEELDREILSIAVFNPKDIDVLKIENILDINNEKKSFNDEPVNVQGPTSKRPYEDPNQLKLDLKEVANDFKQKFASLDLDDIKFDSKVLPGHMSLELVFVDSELNKIYNKLMKKDFDVDTTTIDIETNHMNHIHIDSIPYSLRNIGLGKLIYRKVLQEIGFISTGFVYARISEDAQRVWESLIKSGEYYYFKSTDDIRVTLAEKYGSLPIYEHILDYYGDNLAETNFNKEEVDSDLYEIRKFVRSAILSEVKKSKFQKLEDNKVPLTDKERKQVMDADAVWHFSPGNKPSPAVWKSKDKNGKITYVTNTHRAYQDRPTLKGAISIFHSFIKGTS